MLLELRVENYAVIDRAIAAFGPGLNLLTGETGAGKSILIDALALLLGGKASSDVVRHGAEKAVVGCVFEMTPGAMQILETNGIEAETEDVLLRREIAANGKGRVFVNNQAATVGVLRQLAAELALIHSQGETLGSFDAEQRRLLLDRFAGAAISAHAEAVSERYRAWRTTTEKLTQLQSAEQDRLRMADLWRFQSGEIAAANLAADDEDTQLEAEKRVLANAEKLHTAAMSAYDLLYESEGAAESTLGAALKHLEELARYDASFVEPAQQLAAAKATVEDVSAEVRGFAEKINATPERLEEIEDRLASLDRLKRKYGATLGEVIAFGAEASAKLAEVENRDALLAELTAKQAAEAASYRDAAKALSLARAEAAKRLEKAAVGQINDLAMSARFHIEIKTEGEWSAHGWDTIDCLIATNAGEPMKPLDEIASGGEMSRVMLALKVTVEEAGSQARGKRAVLPRTLVFDEIDIGIGGRAAEAVGRKLKTLSKGQQVLCITHLPQIAAFGDQHFVIEKTVKAGRTQTEVRLMEDEGRVEEIARMLSGEKLTATSLKHAEQLLEISR